ncbi:MULTISPECIES: type IV toxin-antitoxin system AbiEi family antitoxin domain-containing protein [Sphingomonas]|uniref:Type IV toxin-antitoxin system AbiEi family antitoxin domain-containing protein n=1 Tax=Sphingomonas molluscorum TaxID=418184 RepID=A0ABU8QAM5_9SPHN|nr:type IV toxin-antitoxin system AbiEi family antitoxin domain-containing protein [Sphingomonas sp. JUb134]
MGTHPPHWRVPLAQGRRRLGCHSALSRNRPLVLPAWFQKHWGGEVRHMQTKLLPNDIGLTEHRTPEGYPLTAATPERAILELLHLAPKEFDLVEACQIVEGMTSLRPKLMQSLLEACTSVKVRRLFLYLAERADLPVMRHVKVDQIDLGSGDRSLAKMGRYVPKYRLLLPRELVSSGN